ncbi:unannotated protein [freshwater metagenome]|uniref:Unannotated protein n=1 Tax=freshwater metagenome TaxID=449393 RepID=A0A6J7DBX9_9ZZZZ
MVRTSPPVTRTILIGCARPTLRGLDPTRTNVIAVIAIAEAMSDCVRSYPRLTNDSATRIAANVSHSTRTKFTALRWAGTSAAIASNTRAVVPSPKLATSFRDNDW